MAAGPITRALGAWTGLVLVAALAAIPEVRQPADLHLSSGRSGPTSLVDEAPRADLPAGPAPTTSTTEADREPGRGQPAASPSSAEPTGAGAPRTASSSPPSPSSSPTSAPRPPEYDDTRITIPVAHGAHVRAWVQCCTGFDLRDLHTWSEAVLPAGDEHLWHVAETYDLLHLRPDAFERQITMIRLGHLPSASAWLVETWETGGELRYRVTPTAYEPGPRPRDGVDAAVRFSRGWASVYPRGPALELAGLGFDDGGGEFGGPVTAISPTGLLLDLRAKTRWLVTAHRNAYGELFTTERVEPFLPPMPPPIGVPTRYDDLAGAGYVVVTRTSSSTVVLVSTGVRGSWTTAPTAFQSAWGGPCLQMWLQMVYGSTRVRCFDVVVEGGRITAMGFHEVEDPVPSV